MLQRAASYFSGFVGSVENPIKRQINGLKEMYGERTKNFNRWADLLEQEDLLKQDNMESFVSNDPRSTWNMATYLLQPRPPVTKVVPDNGETLPFDLQPSVTAIQRYFNIIWASMVERQDLQRGQPSWMWNFVGLVTATGWFALPHYVKPDGRLFVDYWNPAGVYPEFSDDHEQGLLKLGRVRELTWSQAQSVAIREGWERPKNRQSKVEEGQLWVNDGGMIAHGVCMGNELVKPMTPVNASKIPVLVGYTGGVPSIKERTSNKSVEGQSILETNAYVFNSYNRQMTFIQQLIRDTANPRILERNVSGKTIVNNLDDLYKRGAYFKMGLQDDLAFMQPPGIPPEATNMLLQLRSAMQRGGFSDLSFANVFSEVSAALMSQAAESSRQLTYPFHVGVQYALSEVSNDWYHVLLNNPQLIPAQWGELSQEQIEQLKQTKLQVSYTISIPGDLVNRANIAKGLNPRTEMPLETVFELLLPEISDIPAATQQLELEKAKSSPEYMLINTIIAFESAAAEAAVLENPSIAQLFSSAAGLLRKQLTGQQQTQDRVDISATQRRVGV